MEASNYVIQVFSFSRSSNNQQGLPKWMVDHNKWWIFATGNAQTMHVAFHISIIWRKTKYDFTGRLLCCTKCIIPDHAGIREANRMAIIYMILEGTASTSWWRASTQKRDCKWWWTWILGPICSIDILTFDRVAWMIACPMEAPSDVIFPQGALRPNLNPLDNDQSV